MRRFAAVVLEILAVVGVVALYLAVAVLEHNGAGVHLIERGKSLVVILGVKRSALCTVPPVYDGVAVVGKLVGKSGEKAACLDVFLFVNYKAARCKNPPGYILTLPFGGFII